MTEKELRRLKRAELLEILYYLQKENEELKETLRKQAEAPAQKPMSELPADFTEQLRQMIRETVTAVSDQSQAESGEAQS